MGLLEKALTYKKVINESGRETVMDRIAGPADTEFVSVTENSERDLLQLDDSDLTAVGVEGDLNQASHEEENLSVAETAEIADEIGLEDNDLNAEFTSSIENDNIDDQMLEEFALEGSRISNEIASPVEIKDETIDDSLISEEKSVESMVEESLVVESDFEKNIPTDEHVKDTRIEEMPQASEDISDQNQTIESENSDSEIIVEDAEMLGNFDDYLLLYETEKEINAADNLEDLFEIVLFNLMGQIGSTTSSLILPDSADESRWVMALSRGVTIDSKGLYFQSDEGFLKHLRDRPTIIDIDEFKETDGFIDDYHHFLSIDARYIAPIYYENRLLAAVILGDKVTVEDYSKEDKEFLTVVCRATGITLNNLTIKKKLQKEIEGLRESIKKYREVDWLQEQIKQEKSIDQVEVSLRHVLEELGILSFAVYRRSSSKDAYEPVFIEVEDFLGLKEARHTIPNRCNFSAHLARSESPVVIDDFKHANMLYEIFGDDAVEKMNLFRTYPFVISDSLEGFISIFRVMGKTVISDVDLKLKKIAGFVFDYLEHIDIKEHESDKFIDTLDVLYKKIEEVITNAEQLNIPVSMVMLSIKNYRRYYNLKGYEKGKDLIEEIEKIVKGRLSDHDFAIRFDRNKILLVLPGKDKHFTVPLANVIRNKIVDNFSDANIQLLVTFLTAQYPDDGNDINSLIDLIE